MTSLIVGWAAVILVTALASFWAFWGSIEAFHEGWTASTLGARVLWVLPYLAPTVLLASPGLVAIRWPMVGAALFVTLGAAILLWIAIGTAHFNPLVTTMFTIIPVVIGALFLMGRPRPAGLAYAVTGGIPLLVLLICGAQPAYRVATRIDDGDRRARVVAGNGVTLVWAPAGPGWEREGNVTWQDADERCRHLTADGSSLSVEVQDIWRLPSIDEAVRSMAYHGRNSGGRWDAEQRRAFYAVLPDKESPLWDTHARVIYWWTGSELGHERVWTINYRGALLARSKSLRAGSLGFRAVRPVSAGTDQRSEP